MGGVQSNMKAVCVPVRPPENDDESWVYHNSHVITDNGGQLLSTFFSQPNAHSPLALIRGSATKWPDADCMGEREVLPDGGAGPYRYLSYKTIYERIIQFGRGMQKHGVQKGEKVGIYANNSMWWQLVAFGCYSIGAVAVPVYDSLGPQAGTFIVNHADVVMLCVSPFKFESAMEVVKETPTVKKVCVLGNTIPEHNCGKEVVTADVVLEAGENGLNYYDMPSGDDIGLIMYTSGSTGDPKGCVLTHGNIVAGATGLSCVNTSCTPNDTFLSFLPLAHIYAQAVELEVLAHGGRVAYARGGVQNLMSDIEAMQPTIIIAVPRILNRVSEGMRAKIDKLPGMMQILIKKVMEYKVRCMKENRPSSLLLDGLLFSKFRAALGGRVKFIVSGGAPIMSEVFEFCSATITPNIIQGFGMTELSSAGFVQEVPAEFPDTVGPVSPVCEFKLRKVPDMDYNPQDPEEPAGEAMIRGSNVFHGYFKKDDLTAEVMTKDGWFATGDIVKITKAKEVKVIDRAKQLAKLCQGEYISLTALTEAYQMSDVATFVYVHADSRYREAVAIVWPKPSYVEKWGSEGITDIENSTKVHEDIIASFAETAELRKLRGFERIKHVLVRLEEPTIENGLLTASMKAQLGKIKSKYIDDLNALYQKISE